MNVTRHKIEELVHDPNWDAKGRGAETELRKLATDLEECGQLLPLIAIREGEKLIVIDGNRRLAAARLTHD
jgi:ParB-like chromosome segregation protein Spo0J